MQRSEFEQRTGIYPTESLYKVIEKYYMNFEGDKDAFCAAYKENRDGLAERIRDEANKKEFEKETKSETELKKLQDENGKLQDNISYLNHRLDVEEEWKSYTDTRNVAQKDYEKLRDNSFTEKLTDEKAAEYINHYFGFEKNRIRILHEVPVYEINRHRALREIGKVERIPLYASSDWNYIRFDCADMMYELDDGELRLYVD